jgi:hypothetical protein
MMHNGRLGRSGTGACQAGWTHQRMEDELLDIIYGAFIVLLHATAESGVKFFIGL